MFLFILSYVSVYGIRRVVRSCGFLADENREGKSCIDRSGTHDVHMQYCVCKGDLCNPASRPAADITSIIILSGIFIIYVANL